MPKKRTHNFKPYTTASSSTKPPGKDASAPSISVNDKLLALRLEDTPEALAKKRALAETVNQRSVHPSVRGLLGHAESAPPRPKAGVRVRERFRTPGPAAPKSWINRATSGSGAVALISGRRKRYRSGKGDEHVQRCRPQRLQRFASMCGLADAVEDRGVPKLSHLTLKLLAKNWDLLSEEDYPALVELPLHLRLQLLSYLGFIGPTIDTPALQALTQGGGAVHFLDLGGLICHGSLTIRKLTRLIKESEEARTSMPSTSTDGNMPESWDAEENVEPSLTRPRLSPDFSALSYLCLSNPPVTASWHELLGLSKHTPQLTHLSLASWPRPTLTPNLATTTVTSSRVANTTAGGSHGYNEWESDWTEASVLLRRLSSRLLCLRWLDLEGCSDWVEALSFGSGGQRDVRTSNDADSDEDPWSNDKPGVVVSCMDNWRSLTYINLSQGNVDRYMANLDVDDLVALRNGPDGVDIVRQFDAYYARAAVHGRPDYTMGEARGTIMEMWCDREIRLMRTGHCINNLRKSKRCSPATIDFGWRKSST